MSGDRRCVAILGGRNGLLGKALTHAFGESGFQALPLSRDDFDPLDAKALKAFLQKETPAVLINAVAYTQVDKAEDEPQAAMALNRDLPALLGRACRERGVALVHFSTDFVFDGRQDRPYAPEDPVAPLSVYGASKLAGEDALRAQGLENTLILRTAWLFGPNRPNFVRKILALAAERDSLKVVHDQQGSPTYTVDLAAMTAAAVQKGVTGLHHAVNAGHATWCELAAEAVALAGIPCRIEPIPTAAYPTRAARPAYSVLDCSSLIRAIGKGARPWTAALRDYVFGDLAAELAAS